MERFRVLTVLAVAMAVVGLPQQSVADSGISPAISIIGDAQVVGSFGNPRGVFVTPSGRVLITNYGSGEVFEFVRGSMVQRIASGLSGPHGLAETQSGELLVSEWTGRLRIIRADGSVGAGPVLPSGAGSVAIASDGSIYVSSDEEGVRRFTSDLSTYSVVYRGHAGLMTVLPDGRIAFNSWRDSTTKILNAQGQVTSYSNSAGLAQGLTTDSSGRLYLVDSDSSRVLTLDQKGIESVLMTIPGGAWSIAIDPRGWLYIMGRDGVLRRWPIASAPSAPQAVSAQAGISSVALSWSAPQSVGAGAISSYTATALPGGRSCVAISPSTSCEITGLTRGSRYSFTVVAQNDLGTGDPSEPVSVVLGDRPAAPGNVATAPSDRSVAVSWEAPAFLGDGVFRGYRVTSIPDSRNCTAAASERSCRVTGLRNGVSYVFQVVAINDCGSSDASVSGVSVSFTWPDAPPNVRLKTRTQSGASIQWDAAQGNGSLVTGYEVAVSRDGGTSWTATDVPLESRFEWSIPGMTSATAAYVRVSAINSAGAGPWSDTVLVTSKGAKPVRVNVIDAAGLPVVGGAITWRMSDNSAWSARTYGLTDDGVIEFPMAPAGSVQVTLTGALTADGARVSGSATTILGFNSAVVRLPSTPLQARSVRVVMPNGMPVANATVSVDAQGDQYVDGDCIEYDWDDTCLAYEQVKVNGTVRPTYTDRGFTFTVPVSIKGVSTDSNGEARFSGFFTGDPTATVLYNDGIIVQQQQVVLDKSTNRVELDYMPWVEVAQSTVTADLNTAVPVTVSVAEPTYQSIARGFLPRSMKAGVTVTVIPPKGAPKGSCKAQMTGKTNSQGKVTLKVCATKSGVYGFKTSGAASVSTFKLFVKGTAPMPVTSVTARSLQVGSVRATWGAPLFDGKSPVVSYTVTASAKGKKSVTKTVKANVKNVTLDGLANATTYTVTITATTKKGTSDPVVVSVPVA